MVKESVKTKNKIKNIVRLKNTTKKKIDRRNKKDDKRTLKCNKKLLKSDLEEREILSKINEFNTNGKKTVCYFIDSFYPIVDGVVLVMDNYATFMTQFFNVVVCAPKHNNKSFKSEKYLVIESNSIFLKKTGYDMAFPAFDDDFSKYISVLKIDLIHINSPFTMGSYGLDLAKKRNIPSITTFHSQFKQDFYSVTKSEFMSKILSNVIINIYKKSTVTITMNDFAVKIMKEYGLKRKKVEIIPNATNLVCKDFDYEFENNILKKHNFNNQKFNMIFIGRLVEVKNVYFILDILKQLKQINDDFQFCFLGYGPEEENMKKYCKENNLKNNVIFTGKILDEDEKAILIKNSDLLFFPSTYDTDGIVKIECACYSVPALCLVGTGAASGLVNNETGFVMENDKKQIVLKLDYLIKNVDFVKKIGNNAKNKIYLTWNDVGNKLKIIYDRLLKTKNLKSAKRDKK